MIFAVQMQSLSHPTERIGALKRNWSTDCSQGRLPLAIFCFESPTETMLLRTLN